MYGRLIQIVPFGNGNYLVIKLECEPLKLLGLRLERPFRKLEKFIKKAGNLI